MCVNRDTTPQTEKTLHRQSPGVPARRGAAVCRHARRAVRRLHVPDLAVPARGAARRLAPAGTNTRQSSARSRFGVREAFDVEFLHVGRAAQRTHGPAQKTPTSNGARVRFYEQSVTLASRSCRFISSAAVAAPDASARRDRSAASASSTPMASGLGCSSTQSASHSSSLAVGFIDSGCSCCSATSTPCSFSSADTEAIAACTASTKVGRSPSATVTLDRLLCRLPPGRRLRGQAYTLVVGEPLRRGSPVAGARGQAWLRRGASWQGRTCASKPVASAHRRPARIAELAPVHLPSSCSHVDKKCNHDATIEGAPL